MDGLQSLLTGVLIRTGDQDTDAEGWSHGDLHPGGRSQEDQPCQHLDLRPQASRMGRE